MPLQNQSTVKFLLALFIFSILIVIAGNFLYASINKTSLQQRLSAATLYPTPKPLGHFSLLQKHNEEISEFNASGLQGQWHLVFMGYTSCPHICPTEMQNLKELYQKLPEKLQHHTQVIMVTTDPLKDSPALLDKYVKKFHADFIGLSGNKEQIARFAKQFSMPFFPSDETDQNKSYEVNHSASIYLTNPKGELHAIFSTPHDVDKMHADLLLITQK